jgi:hypothetical protein
MPSGRGTRSECASVCETIPKALRTAIQARPLRLSVSPISRLTGKAQSMLAGKCRQKHFADTPPVRGDWQGSFACDLASLQQANYPVHRFSARDMYLTGIIVPEAIFTRSLRAEKIACGRAPHRGSLFLSGRERVEYRAMPFARAELHKLQLYRYLRRVNHLSRRGSVHAGDQLHPATAKPVKWRRPHSIHRMVCHGGKS